MHIKCVRIIRTKSLIWRSHKQSFYILNSDIIIFKLRIRAYFIRVSCFYKNTHIVLIFKYLLSNITYISEEF